MITAAKESFAQRQRFSVSEERKQIIHFSLLMFHIEPAHARQSSNKFGSALAKSQPSLLPYYTRSARPFTSSSTALARAEDRGAW